MQKILKNEQGSSLLFAIGVLLIFTILGLSLVTITSSGVAKNSTREEIVQSQDLADKGIDFAVKDIQATLEKGIKDNPMGKAAFETFLLNALNNPNLSCTKGIEIPADNNNKTTVCIEEIKDVSAEEKDKYKRLVTFKSTGNVNNKQHVTSSQIIIGTDAIPDQLRYAVSSNDGGNVFLHGGVEIQGDIKTDGNLIVTNQASIGDENSGFSWVPSVHARILKNTNSVTPKIILSKENKDIYFLQDSNSYSSHINITDKTLKDSKKYSVYDPNASVTKDVKSYSNNQVKFFYSNNVSVIRKELPKDNIDVTKTVIDNYNKTGVKRVSSLNLRSTSDFNKSQLNNATKDSKFYYGDYEKVCKKEKCEDKYSNGNLTLNLSNNSSKDPVSLKGIHYVYGNLNIENAFIESDAILYVNGDVLISDSKLSGANNQSTLIIFANGDIKIHNISLYKNDPSKLKAFLYSKKELRIYGTGTNIEITGGISANKVILSGIRGISTSYGNFQDLKGQLSTITNKNGDVTPKLNSRIKVIYDENLITQYTSFKRDEEEEYITELNTPEMVKRY